MMIVKSTLNFRAERLEGNRRHKMQCSFKCGHRTTPNLDVAEYSTVYPARVSNDGAGETKADFIVPQHFGQLECIKST